MEGRVILRNDDIIAVRLLDGTYSVFRLKSACQVAVGDVFLGALSSVGFQMLLHSRSETMVEVQVKLARSQVAAKTKQAIASRRRF